MAATGFLTAQVQLFCLNTDGVMAPAAGGFLYFYTAGTSTPQDTFFESDLAPGHANTNPVVLDSDGRAVIYFSPTPAYKCVFQRSDATTVWTQDQISPAQVAS